jgi:hypothetical protein
VGSFRGVALAGTDINHFQKFLTWSEYGKPYGLLPGGKMFTESEAAAGGNVIKISMIEKTDIATKTVILLKL